VGSTPIRTVATHDQQRHDEHVLAAQLVAVVAEHDPAQRPSHETDRVRREREQGTDERVEAGEEDLVEHQGGGRAVDEEVVPLQRGADQAGHDDATYR
jgi:hypothetical protein